MAWNGSYIKNVFSAIALLLSLCADGFAAGRLLTDTVLNPSMFPGTERSVSVYATERCGGESALLLCFDGDVFASKAVLDSLVANGAMPPVVAVFVNPGVVKDSDGAAVRYNRSNEFDALTGGMPDFVVNVLLPKVGRMLSPLGIGISANPDMHAVAGASSGGIAAFTLAWRRPDVFRRVYCSVGTFVAMRGGDGYPALVRKTEPKPLRIFLHDGGMMRGILCSGIGLTTISLWSLRCVSRATTWRIRGTMADTRFVAASASFRRRWNGCGVIGRSRCRQGVRKTICYSRSSWKARVGKWQTERWNFLIIH